MASDSQNIGLDNRQRAVKTISRHVEDALELQREFHSHARTASELVHSWRRMSSGTYVTVLYLLVKLLYLANVIGQFFLLSSFLGARYRFWGAEILIDLANGREWYDSGHFPRVTLCDFEVRVLGNLHRYTIQCVLMINMFNEKIFLFLWWWFLFVAIANVINFIYWLITCLSYGQRGDFIERYLRVGELLEHKDELVDSFQSPQFMQKSMRKFVTTFLRLDGVFIVRMISTHAGDLITTEIVCNLWKSYTNRYLTTPYAIDPSMYNVNKLAPHKPSYGHGPHSMKTQMHTPLIDPSHQIEESKRENGDRVSPPPDTGFVESYYRTDPKRFPTSPPPVTQG